MEYRLLTNSDLIEWDDFVDNHPQGRYSQLGSYTTFVEETYGLKGYTLGFYENGKLCGILPSILVKPFAQSKKLVSMPFADYGGIVLNNGIVLERDVLAAALDMLLKGSGASHIELKGVKCSGGEVPDNIFFKQPDCENAILKLSEPAGMYKALDHSIKKNLKRAEENALSCENEYSEQIIENIFYPMYLEKMKEFGTAPHPLIFFLNMVRLMKDRVQLFTAKFNGDIAALLWGVKTKSCLNIIFILSEKKYLAYRPNDFVHWEMIKAAYSKGCQFFDFSVARYEGQRKYKEKWGTSFYDYSHYFYPLNKRYSSTPAFVRPGLPNRLWSKYMPKRLASLIGPAIRKKLGR
ncbi:MAG: GNAT family N-acetyltransferase [Dissulfurispiraceae bacterium]